ncbi:unnamed protein product, partial [Rotaria sordida]
MYNSSSLILSNTLSFLKMIASIGRNKTSTVDMGTTFVKEAHKYNLNVLLRLLVVCNNNCILLNVTSSNVRNMIKTFFDYFQYFKLWLSNQSLNITSKSVISTRMGYPSSQLGLTILSGDPSSQRIGNDNANFILQNMAFKAFFQPMDQ